MLRGRQMPRASGLAPRNRSWNGVVGGGIGGSASVLRAAQHGLTVAWIRGDTGTARASRARYVFNVDNMIGVSGGIVQRKVLGLLSTPEHRAASEVIAGTHFHVGIPEIVNDVTLRLTTDFADRCVLKGHSQTERGGVATFRGRIAELNTELD